MKRIYKIKLYTFFLILILFFSFSSRALATSPVIMGTYVSGHDDGYEIGLSSGNNYKAQTFTAPENLYITSLSVNVCKNGSPSDNLYFEIQATTSGHPTGSALDTSDNFSGSSATTCNFSSHPFGVSHTFTFSGAYNLTSGTVYAFVAKRSGTLSGANDFMWTVNWDQNPYVGGSGYSWDGSSWSAPLNSGNVDFIGSFTYSHVIVYGCTDPDASNYDPDATDDDDSCYYVPACVVADEICFHDWLVGYLILIFLLGLIAFGRFINPMFPEY